MSVGKERKMITSVYIEANLDKQGVDKFVHRLLALLQKKGIETYLKPDIQLSGSPAYRPHETGRRYDLGIIIGGDGTVLSSLPLLDPLPPLLPIHKGTLGFISELTEDRVEPALDCILAGDYTLDQRMMLRASYRGNVVHALNDAVIVKGAYPSIATFEVLIDGELLSNTRADGIIVATPTGSTAYSLSCAGPIVHPKVMSLIVNFICPHTLTLRPLVVPGGSTVTVRIKTPNRYMMLNTDGRTVCHLAAGDEVTVTQSDQIVTFLRISQQTFYGMLKKKLHLASGGTA